MSTFLLLSMTALRPISAAAPPVPPSPPGGSDSCYEVPSLEDAGAPGGAVAIRSSFVQLPDGARLRVVEAGPAGGEVLLVLHGYSDSWLSFSRVLPLLADRFRIIAPDLRGHGCSDRPDGGYGMDELAEDVTHVLDALTIDRAAVLGHSMGSLVAQQLAGRHPERVERLVLVGSAVRFAGVATIVELAKAVNALPDSVPVDFVRAFQVSTFHRPLPPDFVEAVIAESMRLPAGVWRSLMDGMLAAESAAPALAAAAVPTLLLWGEFDAVFGPLERDALRDALPDAATLEYEDVGHAPHWETPERFAADVRDFLIGDGSRF
jgi:non-heme chloroperoxidase